jgi:phenylalanyl-tRNA synthetase beta chain
MKVSLNWLRELVELPAGVDLEALAQALTGQGLEVEGTLPKGRELAGVLVAEVLDIKPHPNANKLRIVRVRAGSREESVVCGAPNVPSPGNRVCWAPPGARLPGGHTLDAREVRGVLSPGMICSEPEMGLAEQADGILILPPTAESGVEVAKYLGVVDDVLEVNVTPNRPDALSHLGIARELAAHFGTRLRPIDPSAISEPADGITMDVRIDDPRACPRYTASFVFWLTVAPSPIAMRLRLQYCGIRAISNLVDVTNYVLLETGHPLHAFDFDKLVGPILVRRARPGEAMTTLDGLHRALLAEDIVITDGNGPVALAGVMGGNTSEISDATRNVLLEAATFEPRSIRRTSRRLGLISEASYRFERGVDANSIPFAAGRAAALLAKLGGGSVVAGMVDRYPRPSVPAKVKLRTTRLQRVTGVDYPVTFARDQLTRLGITCEMGSDGLVAVVPTFRPDLTIEEDLIEEILRMGEYGKPAHKERVRSNAASQANPEAPADRARALLASAGLHEIVTWAFVPRSALYAMSADGADKDLADGIGVQNPISADYEVMRTTLLPGLADALKRNLARGASDAWLFEVGRVVRRPDRAGEAPVETTHAAGLVTGRRAEWLKPGEPVDFYDLKRVVQDLLRGFGLQEARYCAHAGVPFLHPGVSALVTSPAGAELGYLGELHPAIARGLGIEPRTFYFELAVEPLATAAASLRAQAPPRFPAVTRDVSFWSDVSLSADAQRAGFLSADEPLLQDLAVLEDFRDPKYVPAGKKGMLWTMTYRAAERTLTDAEADAAHARVVKALANLHAIEIR